MSVWVDIEKRIGKFQLKVSFEAANETLALLGASGCGKSMTLKCIAGIEKPDKGRIVVDDVVFFDSDKKINLSPQDRHVGFMFQNYALFPNMTVLENLSAGAKREKNKEKRRASIQAVLQSFGLRDVASHYPHQLSGGEQQRVALARMLVSSPKLFLIDEPFSALDSHLRFQLEREICSAIRSFGKTVLWVSHDRDEVYRVADQIAVMSNGFIEACGAKHQIFSAPQTKTSAILTGYRNISRIERISGQRVYASDWGIELSVKESFSNAEYIGIRTQDIRLGNGENNISCHVTEMVENPFSYTAILRPCSCMGKMPIEVEIDKAAWIDIQTNEVEISIPADKLIPLKDGAADRAV